MILRESFPGWMKKRWIKGTIPVKFNKQLDINAKKAANLLPFIFMIGN